MEGITMTREQIVALVDQCISEKEDYNASKEMYIDQALYDEDVTTEMLYSECGCKADQYDGSMCRNCGAE